jgi:hypothetical protein
MQKLFAEGHANRYLTTTESRLGLGLLEHDEILVYGEIVAMEEA